MTVGSWLGWQRPGGLVEQARWLFRLGVVASLAVTETGIFFGAAEQGRPLVVIFGAVLVVLWTVRYRIRRAVVGLDLAEVAATMTIAAVAPGPLAVASFAFPALWFRALYGGLVRTMLFCTTSAVGLGLLLAYPPISSDQPVSAAVALPTIATMFITTWIARYLAGGLFAREEGHNRLTALSRLGQRLIGTTDLTALSQAATDCVGEIATATTGMVLLAYRDTGEKLETVDHPAADGRGPATLPRSVLPPDPTATGRVRDPGPLAGLARRQGGWTAVPSTYPVGQWLFLGGPSRIVDDVVPVIESMFAQITLALRTSEAHRDLTLAATCDPLTGLANRGAFTTALVGALGDPLRHVAVMLLDLDDFKLVNDGLGHAAGDELLCRVGRRMRECVREEDLCARLGGDEFAVILVDADDTALGVAQRLVERVASPVSLGGRSAQVGASVGLAFSGRDDGAEELVQHADIAMYAAKAKGKNRVQVFDPSLLQDDGQDVFEAELAAAAGAGQLVVLYQPILSVADGRCRAVEALVRWQHPTRGLLGPGEFIPVAERTGAIADVGTFVLSTACANAAAWSRKHGRLAVHVNVSVAQLTDPSFEDTVRRCIEACALAPKQLVLEITESMVIDSVSVRAALQRLVAIGVAVAIDDFGTGYSALSTLRMLPLEIVKIDKSFIAGAPADAGDEAIVEAVVHMARRVGLQVVVEGVERLDQQQFLERIGADAAQGHLHLRPTPAPQFASWLDRQAVASAPEGPAMAVVRRQVAR